ncbi:DUF6241 domain-containing protein [Planococcus sp. YIM B11945]|uniref:DUF6241 domain-containing protein n=1 Tax=Planococcus sp. YIM B11945 TaxID=3435410 RepID=UPI003D7E9B2E
MKRTIKVTGLLIGFIALAAGGYYFIQQSDSKKNEIMEVAKDIEERNVQGDQSEQEEKPKAAGGEVDMLEGEVQTLLHKMTHQKVKAKEKWGAVEMTPENIEGLLTIVQENKTLYEYGDYYEEVLSQWQSGDFSNSVDVHNFIWQLNGGTIGKATGRLSKAEEKKYIEKNFKD